MPLHTSITRNGKAMKLRWSDFHVAAMVMAASWDSGKGPFKNGNVPPTELTDGTPLDYPNDPCPIGHYTAFQLADYSVIGMTPLNTGPYTLKGTHRFKDCSDGELLELLPGDVLSMGRW